MYCAANLQANNKEIVSFPDYPGAVDSLVTTQRFLGRADSASSKK